MRPHGRGELPEIGLRKMRPVLRDGTKIGLGNRPAYRTSSTIIELLTGHPHDPFHQRIRLGRSVRGGLVDVDQREGDHGNHLGEVLLQVDAPVFRVARIGDGHDVAPVGPSQERKPPLGQRQPGPGDELHGQRAVSGKEDGDHRLRRDLVDLEDECLHQEDRDCRKAQRIHPLQDPQHGVAPRGAPCLLVDDGKRGVPGNRYEEGNAGRGADQREDVQVYRPVLRDQTGVFPSTRGNAWATYCATIAYPVNFLSAGKKREGPLAIDRVHQEQRHRGDPDRSRQVDGVENGESTATGEGRGDDDQTDPTRPRIGPTLFYFHSKAWYMPPPECQMGGADFLALRSPSRYPRPGREGRNGSPTGGAPARGQRGAAKRVEMAGLRAMVSDLGYTEVSTLLNSGNVVFTSAKTGAKEAASRIEKGLAEKLGISCRVIVLHSSELDTVMTENTILPKADNPSRLMVAVLNDPADRSKLVPLLKEDWGDDALAVGARAAFLWCAQGILASKLATEVQRTLKDGVTIRNWATMVKLQALAKK